MYVFFSISVILQVLVIQQIAPSPILTPETSRIGNEAPPVTLKQRLQMMRPITKQHKNNTENFPYGEDCQYTSLDAKNVINSLKSAIHFYQHYSHLASLRMDSVVGVLVFKGNLIHAAKDVEKTVNNAEFLKQLKLMLDESEELSSKMIQLARKRLTHEEIADEVCVIGNNPELWYGPFSAWKSSDLIPKYEGQFSDVGDENDVLNHETNYKCLSTMIKNCDVPSVCQTTYLTDAHSQYMLTHQVLYLLLAEGKSCMTEDKNVASLKDWEKIREKFCAKVFQEAQFIAKNGYHFIFRDLFAEQIGLCGKAGFPNFMRVDWLNEILSWQGKGAHGCFPDIYGEVKTTDIVVNVTTSDEFGHPFDKSCLLHLTSISMSAIATHFRYMFDTCSPVIFKDVLY